MPDRIVMLDELPPRRRWQRTNQIGRILVSHGHNPKMCDINGYEDDHGVMTWWTSYESDTNYIHQGGRSEFLGAEESEANND